LTKIIQPAICDHPAGRLFVADLHGMYWLSHTSLVANDGSLLESCYS